MSSEVQPVATPRWMFWTGWILTLLPASILAFTGAATFLPPDDSGIQMFEHLGWAPSVARGLGLLELTCVVIYLIPRTCVFGAILLTGYFGGAVATHVRVGDPVDNVGIPVLFGVVIWLGLLLRDERLRALLPFRKDPRPLSLLLRIPMVLAGIAVALVILVALQPRVYRIARSAKMSAPPSEVFPEVNDFRKWGAWSPWLKLDPATKVTLEGPPAGVGAVYKWAGNDKVGEGIMTMTESVPNQRVRIKLHFLKPFESKADTEFTFKTAENQTVVTQTMTMQRDFMFKAIQLAFNADKMIGDKFEEGLDSMKKIVEKDAGTKK